MPIYSPRLRNQGTTEQTFSLFPFAQSEKVVTLAGMELKTTGLKCLKDLSLQFEERLVVDTMISVLSTTSVQYAFQEILLLYTTSSQTNLLNHRICPASTSIQANELNANIHRDNGNIAAHSLVHSSNCQASA